MIKLFKTALGLVLSELIAFVLTFFIAKAMQVDAAPIDVLIVSSASLFLVALLLVVVELIIWCFE